MSEEFGCMCISMTDCSRQTRHMLLIIAVLIHLGLLMERGLGVSRVALRNLGFHIGPLPKMHIKAQIILEQWRLAFVPDLHYLTRMIQYMTSLVPRGCLRLQNIHRWALEGCNRTIHIWSTRIKVPDTVLQQITRGFSPAVCICLPLRAPETNITLHMDGDKVGQCLCGWLVSRLNF